MDRQILLYMKILFGVFQPTKVKLRIILIYNNLRLRYRLLCFFWPVREINIKRLNILGNSVVFIIIGAIFWIIAHRGILSSTHIFTHDSFYWFGIFKYFTECIRSGIPPFWNPYIHTGEMFFPYIGVLGLLDPVNLLGILFSAILKINDLFFLYQMIIIFRLILISVGMLLFYFQLIPGIKKHWYFIFFLILLSSFSINSYHQNGAFLLFNYLPFILLFFIKFFDKTSWFNTLMLGYFSGLAFQSYHFAPVGVFICIFAIVFLTFNRNYWSLIIFSRNHQIKLFCAFLLFLGISAPAWSLLFYKSMITPYARYVFNPGLHDAPIFFSNISEFSNTLAAFGELGDFCSLGFLPIAQSLYNNGLKWKILPITEMNMYIASIPFILGVIGISFSVNRHKKVFLIMLFVFAFLFLGPREINIIYLLIFYAFPLLRTIENTHEFANHFLFIYFYFVCLGLVFISSNIIKERRQIAVNILFVVTLVELLFYVNTIYSTEGFNPFQLQKKESIFQTDITYVDCFERNVIFQEHLSPAELLEFDKYYILTREPNQRFDVYKLRENISKSERKKVEDILEKFRIVKTNIEYDPNFNITTRKKSILPFSYISSRKGIVYSSNDENNILNRKIQKQEKFNYENYQKIDKNFTYSFGHLPMKMRLNFRSTIEKHPTAIDYFSDFPYEFIRTLPPVALTFPRLYSDILNSTISQKLKEILFGIDLPVFEFFSNYKVLPYEQIINPEKSDYVIDVLTKGEIILPDKSFIQLSRPSKTAKHDYSIEIVDYKPYKIILNVSNNEDGYLLFRDGFDPNWTAKVDEEKQIVIRANYNQKAISLPKGSHIVEFKYIPKRYLYSVLLYIILNVTVAVLGIIFLCNKYHVRSVNIRE